MAQLVLQQAVGQRCNPCSCATPVHFSTTFPCSTNLDRPKAPVDVDFANFSSLGQLQGRGLCLWPINQQRFCRHLARDAILQLLGPLLTFCQQFEVRQIQLSYRHLLMLILPILHHWASCRAMDCFSGQSTSRALAGKWPEMQSMLFQDCCTIGFNNLRCFCLN